MTPSNDLKLTAAGMAMTQAWYIATEDLAMQLANIFKVFMPEKYAEYSAAFAAGKWFKHDPGPFIGRTIVYKLQLYAHFDANEAGPTISFPSGYFEGGYMEVPQLGARFEYVTHVVIHSHSSFQPRYGPGTAILSWSGILAHRVAPWTPTVVPEDIAARGITPGRIGTVFMFPAASFRKLREEGTDWGTKTAFGEMAPKSSRRKRAVPSS